VGADFIRAGLSAGAPIIVIATRPHREGLCARLARAGLDVQQLLASQQLTLLDARETLARITVDGVPEAERFQQYVGSLIAQRGARSRARVRAYGEMVDVLWKDKQPDAARRLGALWNDLADAQPFSLLCAYAMDNFRTGDESKPFQQICEAHTRVVPTEGYVEPADHELRDRRIALLEQRARALEGEIERRRQLESELCNLKAELQGQTPRTP